MCRRVGRGARPDFGGTGKLYPESGLLKSRKTRWRAGRDADCGFIWKTALTRGCAIFECARRLPFKCGYSAAHSQTLGGFASGQKGRYKYRLRRKLLGRLLGAREGNGAPGEPCGEFFNGPIPAFAHRFCPAFFMLEVGGAILFHYKNGRQYFWTLFQGCDIRRKPWRGFGLHH